MVFASKRIKDNGCALDGRLKDKGADGDDDDDEDETEYVQKTEDDTPNWDDQGVVVRFEDQRENVKGIANAVIPKTIYVDVLNQSKNVVKNVLLGMFL